jgi:hypothetical protein
MILIGCTYIYFRNQIGVMSTVCEVTRTGKSGSYVKWI